MVKLLFFGTFQKSCDQIAKKTCFIEVLTTTNGKSPDCIKLDKKNNNKRQTDLFTSFY